MKAIQVEDVTKSCLVGYNNAMAEGYTALRNVLASNTRNLARKTRDMLTSRQISRVMRLSVSGRSRTSQQH